MTKKLTNMTNEELWQLFPIVLSEYNPKWETIYLEEEKALIKALGKDIVRRINHIGSTSVEGLMAKPTIDILLEVYPNNQEPFILNTLKSLGYITEGDILKKPLNMMFMKGYTELGFEEKVYHLHLREPGDYDELYFRDYLKEHPEVQKAYVNLKKKLKTEYTHHRDNYTNGKTEFIKAYTKEARKKYNNRYKVEI